MPTSVRDFLIQQCSRRHQMEERKSSKTVVLNLPITVTLDTILHVVVTPNYKKYFCCYFEAVSLLLL